MSWYEWLLLILEIPLVWFLWTAAHEFSHYLVAKIFVNLYDVKWWLYPHKDEAGNFYFAKVQWNWDTEPDSPVKNAAIFLAPRIMNIISAVALPFASLLPLSWMIAWIIFWGAGIVDFIIGSLGMSELSDLRKASVYLNLDPNILRVFGFVTIGISLLLCILFICLKQF